MKYTPRINGFTLMELMVTVAILAIIAAIAIPIYSGYIESSYATECSNETAAIRLAEEEFFLVNNRYFLGDNIDALEGPADNGTKIGSGGVYQASYADNAEANCDYKVEAGSTSTIDTSYKITATPTVGGKLEGSGLKIVIMK